MLIIDYILYSFIAQQIILIAIYWSLGVFLVNRFDIFNITRSMFNDECMRCVFSNKMKCILSQVLKSKYYNCLYFFLLLCQNINFYGNTMIISWFFLHLFDWPSFIIIYIIIRLRQFCSYFTQPGVYILFTCTLKVLLRKLFYDRFGNVYWDVTGGQNKILNIRK